MTEKAGCLLPDDVVFDNYEAVITPDFTNFTFRGLVTARGQVNWPVRSVTLHAADLVFDRENVVLRLSGENEIVRPVSVTTDEKTETVTFDFAREIPVSQVFLEVIYSGTLNDKMAGFYRSKYTAPDGTEKYLATTQFEATDARRALPCMDEPARKATFDISLIVPEGMVALSNMPAEFDSFEDGKRRVDFQTTPKMSTYLLALIVGDLEYTEATTVNGTRVRVYTVPGKKEQGAFALATAVRVLEFYNDYFGIPYPLPKLDMAAIPDFAAGAMENWGLVTYRENALLIDPANSSSAAYQRVAEVVAHELAHMWFGNLVTMQWWTHLWLNEGFATFMASLAMNSLFPDWDIWTQFVSDEFASALSLDGLRSTHPIEVEVSHPTEISQIFDSISYSKGASVIRMIHDTIGDEAFRTGLTAYLTRHAYGNATTEDLWDALAEASEQPVRTIMDTWTKQPGYPLITLERTDWIEFGIQQERFLAGGETLTEDEGRQRWEIPLAYVIHKPGMKPFTRVRLCSGTGYTAFRPGSAAANSEPGAFFKLNAGQVALVRVNYTPTQWHGLSVALRDNVLAPVDRYGVISDALSLARAGKLGTEVVLDLVANYLNETNYSVWTAVLGALGAVDSLVQESPDEKAFDAFARRVLEPIVEKLGWHERSGEMHTTQLLRGQVIGAYGAYGDRKTQERATRALYDHINDRDTIPPNLRAAVYGLVARQNLHTDLKVLRDLYEKEALQEEKVRLLNAMGRFTDTGILENVLDYAFNSGRVRNGDFIYVLAAMGSHPTGQRAAWAFMQANWKAISERYSGGGLKMLGRVIELTIGGFTHAADADDIEAFFAANPAPSATRAIAESLERIRIRDAWYRRDKDSITKYLSAITT